MTAQQVIKSDEAQSDCDKKEYSTGHERCERSTFVSASHELIILY